MPVEILIPSKQDDSKLVRDIYNLNGEIPVTWPIPLSKKIKGRLEKNAAALGREFVDNVLIYNFETIEPIGIDSDIQEDLVAFLESDAIESPFLVVIDKFERDNKYRLKILFFTQTDCESFLEHNSQHFRSILDASGGPTKAEHNLSTIANRFDHGWSPETRKYWNEDLHGAAMVQIKQLASEHLSQ